MGKYNPIFYLYYRMAILYESTYWASRSMTGCLCLNMWTACIAITGYFDELVGFGSVIISLLLDMYAGCNFRKIVRLYYGESEECRENGNVFTVLYIIASMLLFLWSLGFFEDFHLNPYFR